MKYAFLGEDDMHPVFVSSSLSTQELDNLHRVLRKHKSTIGLDLKGISPLICMCKILLEDNIKHRAQNYVRNSWERGF